MQLEESDLNIIKNVSTMNNTQESIATTTNLDRSEIQNLLNKILKKSKHRFVIYLFTFFAVLSCVLSYHCITTIFRPPIYFCINEAQEKYICDFTQVCSNQAEFSTQYLFPSIFQFSDQNCQDHSGIYLSKTLLKLFGMLVAIFILLISEKIPKTKIFPAIFALLIIGSILITLKKNLDLFLIGVFINTIGLIAVFFLTFSYTRELVHFDNKYLHVLMVFLFWLFGSAFVVILNHLFSDFAIVGLFCVLCSVFATILVFFLTESPFEFFDSHKIKECFQIIFQLTENNANEKILLYEFIFTHFEIKSTEENDALQKSDHQKFDELLQIMQTNF